MVILLAVQKKVIHIKNKQKKPVSHETGFLYKEFT